MFARVKGQRGAVCLLSGGTADSISPLLDIPLLRIDNLVLEGLACIGRASRE
jgi:type III pantothenate kinase